MPLGADAFVARLVSTGAEAGGADWPPYTAVLVTRVGGRWAVSATRAGGNPDEGAAGPGTP